MRREKITGPPARTYDIDEAIGWQHKAMVSFERDEFEVVPLKHWQ
jgi:hypothetical protein